MTVGAGRVRHGPWEKRIQRCPRKTSFQRGKKLAEGGEGLDPRTRATPGRKNALGGDAELMMLLRRRVARKAPGKASWGRFAGRVHGSGRRKSMW